MSTGAVVVCGRVFTPEVMERIRLAVESHPEWPRSRVAREVCCWLGWRDANGKLKEMSCRKALLRLAERKLIELPAARREVKFRGGSYQSVESEVAGPLLVELSDIKGLELVQVQPGDRQLSAQWNQLVALHHYLGYRPMAGAQVRYLVGSEHGYLGALGFRSAALRSKARERWIGWSEQERQAYLDRVVCNARFVIAKTVHVKNLASRVLSMALERLPQDWQKAYGIEPVVVETYVDSRRFAGTCYQAANWEYVGQTRGGRGGEIKERKAIYACGLRPDWRQRLCEVPGPGRMSEVQREQWSQQMAARDGEDWVARELRTARLGDRRLRERLCRVMRSFAEQPTASIPRACGTRSETKAAYRLFGRVKMETILAAHYDAVLARVHDWQPAVVLAVNDSTSFNYTAHPSTEGLGPINNSSDAALGLWMHETMLYDTEGIALGLIDVQLWARDAAEKGQAAKRHSRPIEDKESGKWLKSFAAATRLQRQLGPATTVVCVGDREADIYELMVRALSDAHNAKLLVRADGGQRVLAADGRDVGEAVASLPAAGRRSLDLPRSKGRPARRAELEIRFCAVALRPPKRHRPLGVAELSVVCVSEVNAPAGIKPIEWMLWTTMAVTDADAAWEKVDWYKRRWGIEEFHRTLKSGCRIEERQIGSSANLLSCVAVDLVVAWRIEHMKRLSRHKPDLPCTVVFEPAEWQVLAARFKPEALATQTPLGLREAVRLTAQLGGFLGRKGDGEPGSTTLWHGLTYLRAMVAGWLLAHGETPQFPAAIDPTVLGHGNYG